MTGWAEVARTAWTRSGASDGRRDLPAETPVALVVDAVTAGVMLATPDDLGDLVAGFALTEGLIASRADIAGIEVVEQPDGIEARLWLVAGPRKIITARRLAAPTGCGLCGVESLVEARRVARKVTATGPRPEPAELLAALSGMADAQPLGARTRATHAASLWRRHAPVLVREDVGRHNALDKLAGACVRDAVDASDAMILLTSRVSVEMVTKAAAIGAPILVAVSAPTTLAVETAAAAGLTLIAVARGDGFEVFTHPERLA